MARRSSYSAAARHEARHILAQAPFRTHPARSPAPLAGLLHAIGRGLDDAFGKPLAWLWAHTVGSLHGALGNWSWVALGVVALGVSGIVGTVLVRRRGAVSHVRPSQATRPDTANADALEHAADDAESRGANDLAVRLRFEAGLARLETRGVIASRLTTPTDRLRARLASANFDRLADRHEAIAYAHDEASKDDVESSRAGWQLVLEETGKHLSAPPVEQGP